MLDFELTRRDSHRVMPMAASRAENALVRRRTSSADPSVHPCAALIGSARLRRPRHPCRLARRHPCSLVAELVEPPVVSFLPAIEVAGEVDRRDRRHVFDPVRVRSTHAERSLRDQVRRVRNPSRPPSASTRSANRSQRSPNCLPFSIREMTVWSMPREHLEIALAPTETMAPRPNHLTDEVEAVLSLRVAMRLIPGHRTR